MSLVNQESCYTEEEKAFYNACWECRYDFSNSCSFMINNEEYDHPRANINT
jgi:hypothetical protein